MPIKKILRLVQLLLILFAVGFFPSGCDDCGKSNVIMFKVNALHLHQLALSDSSILIKADTLAYVSVDSCILGVGIENVSFALNKQPEKTKSILPNFSNPVFACDPPLPNNQRLKKFAIIAENAVRLTATDSVKTGQDITPYFLASQDPGFFYSDSAEKVARGINLYNPKGYILYLKPNFIPQKETTLTFHVFIDLSDAPNQVFSQRELRIK